VPGSQHRHGRRNTQTPATVIPLAFQDLPRSSSGSSMPWARNQLRANRVLHSEIVSPVCLDARSGVMISIFRRTHISPCAWYMTSRNSCPSSSRVDVQWGQLVSKYFPLLSSLIMACPLVWCLAWFALSMRCCASCRIASAVASSGYPIHIFLNMSSECARFSSPPASSNLHIAPARQPFYLCARTWGLSRICVRTGHGVSASCQPSEKRAYFVDFGVYKRVVFEIGNKFSNIPLYELLMLIRLNNL
jgi:hypothetical protein